MEVLASGYFDIKTPKRTEKESIYSEPASKRRLISADTFCFSLEDLTNHLYNTHDASKEDPFDKDDFCFWCDAKRYQDSFQCPYHQEQARKPYAYQNIPNMLELYEPSETKTAVRAVKPLPSGAWIGPYEGKLIKKDEVSLKNDFMWEVFKDGKLHGYIDGSDVNKSSWMRFIKRAEHKEEQNLWAFQYQDKIFYRVNKTISPGQELMVWYDQEYVKYADVLDTRRGNDLSPVSLPSLTRQHSRHGVSVQMETNFNIMGALESSSVKPPPAFPRISSCETETATSKPIPRVSTGFSLQITDNKPMSQHSSAVSSPTSPFTPSSNDSRFSFESVDSPTKSDETCVWRCGQCNESFAQRAMLQVHVCANVSFKPFKCGHCDKSFTTAGEMRAHAVIHQGKKPFKCGYCSRSFTGATTLNNHIRIHTGEKPFKCTKCWKTFSQGSQLSKHERIPGDCIPKNN